MWLPGAAARPVVNHGGPMARQLGLVVHVQQGDGSPFGWFNDPASQVSSHLWVGKDGTLEQYVDLADQAWAQVAGNPDYLSIETEGFDTEELTAEQVGGLSALIAWGHRTLGWPAVMVDHGGRGITTHAHWPSGTPDPAWGGHPCPGPLRAGQLANLVARLGPIPAPPAPPINLEGSDMVIIACEGKPTYWWTGAKRVQILTPAQLSAVRDGLGVPLKELDAEQFDLAAALMVA